MSDPRQFYQSAYNAVLEAARRQGAPHPETLAHLGATQAAHETAWGKHAPANNFFGIKGGNGPAIRTHEVMGGRNLAVMDHFRGYPSMQASADDYVKLLGHKPRYAGVYNAASVPDAIRAQAHSGYATDPQYGQKLASIHQRGSAGGGAPAPVQVAARPSQTPSAGASPATPSARPAPAPVAPTKQADTLLSKVGFVNSANAGELPKSDTLPRINKADPSGPLTPRGGAAPVNAPPATPAQVARPVFDPGVKSPDAPHNLPPDLGGAVPKQISAGSMELSPVGTKIPYGLGQYQPQPSMGSFPAPGLARDLNVPGNSALPPQPWSQSTVPVPASATPPVPAPATPTGPTPPVEYPAPTGGATPAGPSSYTTPSVPTDTTPASNIPDVTPITPTDTTPIDASAGGGAEGAGGMLSGLMDALSNLGGGGEGGGAQPPGGGGGQNLPPAIPDFPRIGADINMGIAQRGQMANVLPATAQQLGASMPMGLKAIGAMGQPQMPSPDGFAVNATKRLFT